jgi:signal transduction histidine kinase
LRQSRKYGEANVKATSLTSPLEKIEAQTGFLSSLVYDLLDISSLMGGKLPLRLTIINISTLCHTIVGEQRLLSERRFEEKYPAAPLLLQADEARLTQVVSNLVTNAIKYSWAETTIQVYMYQQQDSALLTVHNDGNAIPQAQQNDLFEPFYRTPDARSSLKEGWGLGLAISKQIVERHKGRIWVESSEGKGTTFCVELPLSVF